MSGWGSASRSFYWESDGTKCVKVRARCATHTNIVSPWSNCRNITISGCTTTETVGKPNPPSGPSNGSCGTTYQFTGSASSNLGHSLEYQFDEPDGMSGWGSASRSFYWLSDGTKCVKVRARCATHTNIVSPWSNCRNITISGCTVDETISTPGYVSGSAQVNVGVNGGWALPSSSRSTSSLGHPVEYRIDWGDRTYSSWSATTSYQRAYTSAGTFDVRAQARCATHTVFVSQWGPSISVEVGGTRATYSVYDAWWTSVLDQDGDGYSRDRRLNFDVDVSSGTHSVYAYVYQKTASSGSYSLYTTTSNFTITGSSSNDAQAISVGLAHGELSHNTYDFRIDIRKANTTNPVVASRGPSNDADLDDERFETAGEDGGFGAHTVSKPRKPEGPPSCVVNQMCEFSTGGSQCSRGHPVEYRFMWGDSPTMSSWGSSVQSHAYALASGYYLIAQARCSVDHSVMSNSEQTLFLVGE